jgi:hypothetical protein
MASKREVEKFLDALKVNIDVFNIFFEDDRKKNIQALLDLDITPDKRVDVIRSLKVENYAMGPVDENMQGYASMWIFGSKIKNREIYIKISMGKFNGVICISFHPSEHPLTYPYKK